MAQSVPYDPYLALTRLAEENLSAGKLGESGTCVWVILSAPTSEVLQMRKDALDKVTLTIGLAPDKMARLNERFRAAVPEMGDSCLELPGVGEIPVVVILNATTGVTRLIFDATNLEEDRLRGLFDAVMALFPWLDKRNWPRHMSLAMALHPRLGEGSPLAELGDVLPLVVARLY